MKMLKVSVAAVAIAAVLLAVSSAQAAIVVTADQIGANVVVSLTGNFNTSSGVLFGGGTIGASLVYPSFFEISYGNSTNIAVYTHPNFTGPSNFGPGSFTISNSSSNVTGFNFDGSSIGLPVGYVSLTPLSESMTFNSATFASLGMTPGTYTWSWSNGLVSDSLTLDVGQPVPEGSTLVLMLVGLGLVSVRFVRRKLVA